VIDGLPEDFPPLRTLDVETNLPLRLTSFVGRERQLAEVRALVGEHRLVTLVGPGGTGKTRLSLEVAAEEAEGQRDGVFFVDLSSLRDADLVPSTIAQSLGLKEGPNRPALETVTGYLADRRALMVLDNFEQVIDAAAAVEQILRAAPGVTVLTTSRTRLGLMGEQGFPVPPLVVPDEGSDPATLATSEAVALFVERARAVEPGFTVTEANAAAVVAICARLDGLPLAIELAAAQIRLLTPAEMLARLERRLPLRAGPGNVPERQRTLRGAIEWSYQLLDPPDRQLFARLSVFAGGASLAAIDEVCNPDGDLGLDTFDAVASLFDQSLVRRAEASDGSRFTMLETIREYAGERLREDFDAEQTERRHAEFFLRFVEEWGPQVRGPKAPEAIEMLTSDHDNVRAALDWSVREDRADLGLGIAAPMWMFWVERFNLAEGRRAIQGLLALPSGAARDRGRARGLNALAALHYWGSDYESSAAAYTEALAIYRELGDEGETAQALSDLVYALLALGEAAAALPIIDESMSMAKRLGNATLEAVTGGELGLARAQLGDYDGALAALRESMDVIQKTGMGVWVGEWMGRIGSVLRVAGRLDEAEERLRSSLRSGRMLAGNVSAVAVTWQLAALASQREDHERALRLAGFSDFVSQKIGGTPPRMLMLLPEIESIRTAARSTLDDQTIERLWDEGGRMTVNQAIAFALEEET
jgi:predicted ATPase